MTHIEPDALDDLADIVEALEDGGVDVTDVRRVERTVSNIGMTGGRYAARLDIEWSASGGDDDE